jgi:hypothetical protein
VVAIPCVMRLMLAVALVTRRAIQHARPNHHGGIAATSASHRLTVPVNARLQLLPRLVALRVMAMANGAKASEAMPLVTPRWFLRDPLRFR